MSDEIIGTSVLQGDELYVCAYSPTFQGGFPHWTSIPVATKDAPGGSHPLWRYTKQGNILHVTPSVHILGGEPQRTMFHNSGNWSTPFIEVPESEDALEKCIELNREAVYALKGKPK